MLDFDTDVEYIQYYQAVHNTAADAETAATARRKLADRLSGMKVKILELQADLYMKETYDY